MAWMVCRMHHAAAFSNIAVIMQMRAMSLKQLRGACDTPSKSSILLPDAKHMRGVTQVAAREVGGVNIAPNSGPTLHLMHDLCTGLV